MAEPLNRPLANHRLLREVSGPDLTVSLGTGLRAVYETPTMGELAAKSWELGNTTDAFTEEEKNRVREAEFERQRRIRALEANVEFLQDGQERDDALAEIQALQSEKQTQINSLTQDAIEQGRLQPPEALTEEYGELGLTFDRPMTNEQARILADNKRAEIIRNALIEKSPQGLGAGLLKFGAGLAAMATDPLEVATTFIPVAGPALKARAVSRLGQVGGRVAIGATEGAVGQALVEPIYYGLSKQQQLDYTMADALTNVGFGLLFGGGVGAVAGVLGRRAQRARLDPKLEKDAAEISFRQFATDQSVDVTRFFDGRDVRSQAPIFRSSGVEFQEPAQDRVGYISRPSYLAGDDSGSPLAFDSQQKANDFANKNGGNVVHIRDGFAVRITSDGDFIRTPSGKPVEFSELGRADDFVNSSRLTGVESEGIDLSAAISDSLEEAQKDDSRFVKPLVEFIRRSPEVDGATLQVHPEGRAADELRSKGITPRSAPGLFSRRGRKDFDNLVANEFEKEFPGIIEATGTSRSEFYLDPDGFIDLIKRDVEGDSNWLNSREKVSAIIRDAEKLLYNVDLEPQSGYLADFNRKDRLFIDPDEYEFVHGNLSNIEIEKDLRGYIERNQIEFLSDEDFKIALEELQEKGGDVEAIVDSFAPARDDFVKEKTSAPTGSKVVKIGENRYLIAHNMSDADIRSIERNPDLVEIPRGIDTRKESILSSPSDPISEALTGPAAQKQVASELAARSADVASDPYADVGAAQRATEISKGNADLQASAREDIDYLQRIVDQIENDGQLDDLSRAEIAELNQIDEKARAYREVAEAAAVCLTRS